MKTRTVINEDGSITLTATQKSVLIKHAGKPAYLTIDERSNSEKIGFIEGAIDRFFFYQHQAGVYENFKDARGGLKWACNHTKWEFDDKGKKKEVARSMSEIYANKTRTQNFIDRCEEYFRENGYLFPDSSHYCEWRDSGVGVNEVYPPLLKLKERYEELKKQALPVWHKNK